MNEYDSSDLKSTLKYIKFRFGAEPFLKQGRVFAIMLDLAPELIKERNMIERFSSLGFLEEFAIADISDNALQNRIITKAFTTLTEENYIPPNIAVQYINIFSEVFDWSERADSLIESSASNDVKNNIENKNITTANEPKNDNSSDNSSAVRNIVQRGVFYLENEEWNKADEFFEKALLMNAKDPMAYFCKMLVECRIKHPSQIAAVADIVRSNVNFKIAYKLASPSFRKNLDGYLAGSGNQQIGNNSSQIQPQQKPTSSTYKKGDTIKAHTANNNPPVRQNSRYHIGGTRSGGYVPYNVNNVSSNRNMYNQPNQCFPVSNVVQQNLNTPNVYSQVQFGTMMAESLVKQSGINSSTQNFKQVRKIANYFASICSNLKRINEKRISINNMNWHIYNPEQCHIRSVAFWNYYNQSLQMFDFHNLANKPYSEYFGLEQYLEIINTVNHNQLGEMLYVDKVTCFYFQDKLQSADLPFDLFYKLCLLTISLFFENSMNADNGHIYFENVKELIDKFNAGLDRKKYNIILFHFMFITFSTLGAYHIAFGNGNYTSDRLKQRSIIKKYNIKEKIKWLKENCEGISYDRVYMGTCKVLQNAEYNYVFSMIEKMLNIV